MENLKMKTGKFKGLVTGAVSGVLLLGATAANATQAGDMILRAGLAGVLPTGDSDEIATIASGAKVEADDGYSLGITFTWMATDNLGVGVLAAWPFEHDIEGAGAIASADTVGDTKHLPPTVTLQWHFPTGTNIHPYVGAGVNYTYFFDEDTTGALAGESLDLDDSWGLAAEAGVDFDLGNDLVLSGQLWYLDIDTEATVSGGVGSFDVSIDPWVFMVGIGKKF
jgi:outer membrane protein